MTMFYVASAGNDANTGLSALVPWLTGAKAVASAAASDIINLNRGDLWRERVLGPATGQTWRDYGAGELPKISAMDLVPGPWTSTTPANTWSATWAISLATVTAVDVNGILFLKGTSQAALTLGQFWWAAGVLYLCISGGSVGMTGYTIEANGNRTGAFVTGASKGGYTFRNLWFHGGTDGTFNTTTPTSADTWIGCRFGHGGIIGSVGLLFVQDTGSGGHIVTDCLFENGITDCLFFTDNERCVVSYCTFISLYGPVSDHIQFTGLVNGSGGATVHHCYGFIQADTTSAKGFIVHGQPVITGGFNCHDNFCDGGNYLSSFGHNAFTGFANFTADRNVHVNGLNTSSVGTFGDGGISSGCRWSFNVSLHSAGPGFNFFGDDAHTGVGIYNNTVYGSTFRGFTTGGSLNTISGVIQNNIFHSNGSSHRVRIDGGGVTFDHNFVLDQAPNFIFWGTTNYATMAAFQAGSGQGGNCSITNPMLWDTVSTPTRRAGEGFDAFLARAFRQVDLDPSSQAISAGVAVAGINDSFLGPAPDIGAREWAGKPYN
jgi:hypothetical protein